MESNPFPPFTVHHCSAGEPHLDIALEEALFRSFERTKAGPLLRLWVPSVLSVVLGIGRSAAEDVRLDHCVASGIPVIRRFSGGGTVVHDPGQLCFSFFLPFAMDERLRDITESWLVVHEMLVPVFNSLDFQLDFERPCDFVVKERKICGNASRRGTHGVLIHGTILVSSDIHSIGDYLNHPADEPGYRKGRAHGEFVTSLRELGSQETIEGLVERLLSALPVAGCASVGHCVLSAARDLVVVKYSRDDWNLRV